MARKVIRCYCGYVVEGEDDELVTAVQGHVRDVHRMEYTREEVLAMAAPTD
jgi:predicted small metal-binding protein